MSLEDSSSVGIVAAQAFGQKAQETGRPPAWHAWRWPVLEALAGVLILAAIEPASAQPVALPASVPEVTVSATRSGFEPDERPIEQLSPQEVSAYGVDSVSELLNQLKPRTASSMSDEAPLVLVNGRVAGSTELDDLPPEAILRVDILPEKAALRYGFEANRRVVNLILREHYRAYVAGMSDRQPTQSGGGNAGAAHAALTRIDHDAVDTVRLDYSQGQDLLESDRGIESADSSLRTLVPATQEAKLAGSLVRPIFGLRPSLEASVDVKSSDSLQGLASDNGLDAAQTAALAPLPGDPLLKQHITTTSLHLAARVTGLIHRWIWSLAATGNQSGSQQRVNADATQAPGSLVLDRSGYTLDTGRTDGSIGGPLLGLPAGPLVLNLHLTGEVQGSHDQSQSPGEASDDTHLSRTTGSTHVRVEIPLTSRTRHALPLAGDVTARGSLGAQQVSQVGTLRSYGYGLSWSPLRHVYLSGDLARLQLAPSVQDLLTPAVVTPGVQTFDFVTGQTDYVTEITGGNPELMPTDRRLMRLGLFLGDFGEDSGLYASFERRRDTHAVGTLPALTYPVELAFPERLIRDDTGTLIEVDDRPLNLALEASDVLNWGVNLGFPFSKEEGRSSHMRLFVSLDDTWYLRDTVLVASGVPELDLLNGAPSGASGAQPRNALQLWATFAYHALGIQVYGRWHSASHVDGGTASAPEPLEFRALGTLNLRVFASLGRLLRASHAGLWAKNLRISLSVTNLMDARESVVDAAGATPEGFLPGYLDPFGRMVSLSLRKVF